MTQFQRYLTLALCSLLLSCSESDKKVPSANAIEKTPPPVELGFIVPEIPDPLEYAATELPTEPFRFVYQFQSDQLGFTIKANQLDERVICDIAFEDGSSFPVELYVNQYRTLVNDLIQAAASSKSATGSNPDHFESILVQSVAKTHRLKKSEIPLSKEFIKWVSKQLQTDANRALFESKTVKTENLF